MRGCARGPSPPRGARVCSAARRARTRRSADPPPVVDSRSGGAFYFQPNAVSSSTCRPPASWPSIGRTPPRRSEPRSRAPAHGGGRGEEPELLPLFLSIILSRVAATKRRQKRTGGQERKATKIQKRRLRYAGRSAAGGKQRATKKGRGAEPKGGREVHIVYGLRTASDCIMQIVSRLPSGHGHVHARRPARSSTRSPTITSNSASSPRRPVSASSSMLAKRVSMYSLAKG